MVLWFRIRVFLYSWWVFVWLVDCIRLCDDWIAHHRIPPDGNSVPARNAISILEMRSFLLCFLLCCSIALSKYSYTDRCYRYEQDRSSACRMCYHVKHSIVMTYYQYYINRKGTPLSSDYIIYDKTKKEDTNPKWSYYFQWVACNDLVTSYVLTDCKHFESKYECTRTCESIWFKIWNVTAAEEFVQVCDKEFIGRYADIM